MSSSDTCGGLDETGCVIHAYVLMTNHVHLLVTGPRNRAPFPG